MQHTPILDLQTAEQILALLKDVQNDDGDLCGLMQWQLQLRERARAAKVYWLRQALVAA